jgi:hypothetical protein
LEFSPPHGESGRRPFLPLVPWRSFHFSTNQQVNLVHFFSKRRIHTKQLIKTCNRALLAAGLKESGMQDASNCHWISPFSPLRGEKKFFNPCNAGAALYDLRPSIGNS